jgi:hypothetical protein
MALPRAWSLLPTTVPPLQRPDSPASANGTNGKLFHSLQDPPRPTYQTKCITKLLELFGPSQFDSFKKIWVIAQLYRA